jgi:hypothetical protein
MREGGTAAREVEAVVRCLNCGAGLTGAFCSRCGQRAIPADPTVAEIAGDVWQELSGYDGRVAATFRTLLHPGRLTLEHLQGRRAHYLSPIRLYLTVSVIYFLVAAAAPITTTSTTREVDGPGGLRISVSGSRGAILTDEDRANIERDLETAPWPIRPMLKAINKDPDAFRTRVLEIMPRVFFGLLPVFAAIVALFYRRRRFPTALVFAVHLHAFAFLILTVPEASKMVRWRPLSIATGIAAGALFLSYALIALRNVYGGRWPITFAKAAGIAFVYVLCSVPAFFIILIWASLV